MSELVLEQEGKQRERILQNLPLGERDRHPYCDKCDTFWYRTSQGGTGSIYGDYSPIRGVPVYSYQEGDGGLPVISPQQVAEITVLEHITPALITYAGLWEDEAWLFSRPLQVTRSGLVFPKKQDLWEQNYDKYGLYFPIRPINAYGSDMDRLVRFLKRYS